MSVMPSTTIGDVVGRNGDFDGTALDDFVGMCDGDFVGLNLVGLKLGALLGLLVMIWNSELAHCNSKKSAKLFLRQLGQKMERTLPPQTSFTLPWQGMLQTSLGPRLVASVRSVPAKH